MPSLYTLAVRPLLFQLAPEAAHQLAVEACRMAGAIPGVPSLVRSILEFSAPQLEIEVAGLRFANPLGLAAGWDKSGRALAMIDSLGFGFAEIGSVSARPSRGNPKPRLFRIPSDQAIIVNYGLPNDGAEVVAQRLASNRTRHPLGVNIVKTNDGPEAPFCSEEKILTDYERSVALLHSHANYLALNLSCPNATGGKDFFATPGSIQRLLQRLLPLNVDCPIFLKVAPNPDVASIERLISEVEPFPIVRGFIFNLPSGKPESLTFTTHRDSIVNLPGAVSGKPVAKLINSCIRELYQRMPPSRFVIIGAGGVFTAEDAYLKIQLGASLVQIYTAIIYEGPALTRRINHGLIELLARDGFANVREAVGSACIGRSSS